MFVEDAIRGDRFRGCADMEQVCKQVCMERYNAVFRGKYVDVHFRIVQRTLHDRNTCDIILLAEVLLACRSNADTLQTEQLGTPKTSPCSRQMQATAALLILILYNVLTVLSQRTGYLLPLLPLCCLCAGSVFVRRQSLWLMIAGTVSTRGS